MVQVNKIKLLFLDDDKFRSEFVSEMVADFNSHFDDAVELHLAENFSEFKKRCEKANFDVVCFDHDLAPEHYENFHSQTNHMSENTGLTCAQWYVDFIRNVEKKPYVLVHSWNPPGAANIIKCLEDAGGYQGARITFGKEFLDALWDQLVYMATDGSEDIQKSHTPNPELYFHSLEF